MFGDFVASLRDLWRHRFGSISNRHTDTTDHEDTFDARRSNEAEARVVGRTMGEPNGIRAWSKGDRR
jgi:hypothetical protein